MFFKIKKVQYSRPVPPTMPPFPTVALSRRISNYLKRLFHRSFKKPHSNNMDNRTSMRRTKPEDVLIVRHPNPSTGGENSFAFDAFSLSPEAEDTNSLASETSSSSCRRLVVFEQATRLPQVRRKPVNRSRHALFKNKTRQQGQLKQDSSRQGELKQNNLPLPKKKPLITTREVAVGVFHLSALVVIVVMLQRVLQVLLPIGAVVGVVLVCFWLLKICPRGCE